jgi:hypothetical protein
MHAAGVQFNPPAVKWSEAARLHYIESY